MNKKLIIYLTGILCGWVGIILFIFAALLLFYIGGHDYLAAILMTASLICIILFTRICNPTPTERLSRLDRKLKKAEKEYLRRTGTKITYPPELQHEYWDNK
jgi:hypothetical protein